MICQLRPPPCLTGSLPHTHTHTTTTTTTRPQARPLRPNYCSACVSVCLCKKQGSAGQKVKSKEEARWKRLEQEPSPRPVGKSSSLGRDQQPSLVCHSTFSRVLCFCYSISILSKNQRGDEENDQAKRGTNRAEPSRPRRPLPSTLPSSIVISPGCWAARGSSPETRILLLVCQDRRF